MSRIITIDGVRFSVLLEQPLCLAALDIPLGLPRIAADNMDPEPVVPTCPDCHELLTECQCKHRKLRK